MLYNGASTRRNVYETLPLSGIIVDQAGGFGTVSLPGPSNGIQNGSPDGLAIVDPDGAVQQFLSYEGTFTAADGPAAGQTSTDIGEGDGGGGTDPDPEPEPCDIPVTHEIGAVQGEGGTSPLQGQTVTIEGVVVGDFQENDQLGGVFLQDADGDANEATSDGIFVFDADHVALAEGDVVRVTGTVDEFFGLTEITDVTAIGDCVDASTVQNPDDVPFTDVDGEVIRLGDTVTGIEGILSYGFDVWRLQPTQEPIVERTNPRPESPDEVGGDVQVASFNVLNSFTTIDAAGATTDTGDEPRGANSADELERQQAKIVEAILALDAEIVGLMEIENDSDDAALDHLVAALNAAAGEERYAAIEEPDTGGGLFGTDAIEVAMIYQPAEVIPMGAAVTTQDEAFDNARLPLAQRFRPADGGQPFTVVVNHFKSKGCGGATGRAASTPTASSRHTR